VFYFQKWLFLIVTLSIFLLTTKTAICKENFLFFNKQNINQIHKMALEKNDPNSNEILKIINELEARHHYEDTAISIDKSACNCGPYYIHVSDPKSSFKIIWISKKIVFDILIKYQKLIKQQSVCESSCKYNETAIIYKLKTINNRESSLEDIRKLAQEKGLFTIDGLNKHLCFKENDIIYWFNQKLDPVRLEMEFTARQTILRKAKIENFKIFTQENLSKKAEQFIDEKFSTITYYDSGSTFK